MSKVHKLNTLSSSAIRIAEQNKSNGAQLPGLIEEF